jgi:hypothetical protein
MNAATTVTATFTLVTNTLTVTRTGAGGGTVSSAPAGINCGADCTEAYNFGTLVTLTAVADATSAFGGWTGAGCAGTGTCAVTMNQTTAVTALFNIFEPRWPDSGTRFCTDGAAAIACPGGPVGQDGFYQINVPAYVVLGGRVQDPVTGFIWERNPPITGLTHAAAITYCNDLSLDGFDDWRLPSYLELISIADFGATVPGFTVSAFPGIPQNSNYWTSTDRATSSTQAFAMNTNYPTTTYSTKSDAAGRIVRCVRGTPLTGALTVAGGSVTDNRTKLVWQSATAGVDMLISPAVCRQARQFDSGPRRWCGPVPTACGPFDSHQCRHRDRDHVETISAVRALSDTATPAAGRSTMIRRTSAGEHFRLEQPVPPRRRHFAVGALIPRDRRLRPRPTHAVLSAICHGVNRRTTLAYT